MPDKPTVVAASKVAEVKLVDGGLMFAIHLEDAQGSPLHILLPAQAVAQLATAIAEAASSRKI